MTKIHLQEKFARRLNSNICAGCGEVIEIIYFTHQFKKYCDKCYKKIEQLNNPKETRQEND